MEKTAKKQLVPVGASVANLSHPGLTFLGRDPTDVHHYLAVHASITEYDPEWRLMLAVLEDAIGAYTKYARSAIPKHRTKAREVEEWMASTEADSPFSFENICDVLKISADYLRKGLQKWKTQYTYVDKPVAISRIRVIRQHGHGRRQTL